MRKRGERERERKRETEYLCSCVSVLCTRNLRLYTHKSLEVTNNIQYTNLPLFKHHHHSTQIPQPIASWLDNIPSVCWSPVVDGCDHTSVLQYAWNVSGFQLASDVANLWYVFVSCTSKIALSGGGLWLPFVALCVCVCECTCTCICVREKEGGEGERESVEREG